MKKKKRMDDASADLALAKSFGLKGFTDNDQAHREEHRERSGASSEINNSPSTKSPSSHQAKQTAADLELARRFGLVGFV